MVNPAGLDNLFSPENDQQPVGYGLIVNYLDVLAS